MADEATLLAFDSADLFLSRLRQSDLQVALLPSESIYF